jgi:hypothetical protein
MSSDRERLVEILVNNIQDEYSKKSMLANDLADAILAAGFGDVAEKDKRIAELEKQLEANGHDNDGNPIKYGVS